MTGIPLIIAFVVAVVLMIVAISKFKVHPFLSIMGVSLVLALVAGIPLTGIADVIGAGFSGTFSSIGIVIILGALIGTILEKTGASSATISRVNRSLSFGSGGYQVFFDRAKELEEKAVEEQAE